MSKLTSVTYLPFLERIVPDSIPGMKAMNPNL